MTAELQICTLSHMLRNMPVYTALGAWCARICGEPGGGVFKNSKTTGKSSNSLLSYGLT